MKPTRFIIVDDDHLDTNLCKLYIRHALPQMEIVDFNKPEQGLNYIQTAYSNSSATPSILLLDLNMTTMTGWEFLEKYDKYDQYIKDQITVYIVSSSIDMRDTDKAATNKYIKGYLVKPTTVAVINNIYNEYS